MVPNHWTLSTFGSCEGMVNLWMNRKEPGNKMQGVKLADIFLAHVNPT